MNILLLKTEITAARLVISNSHPRPTTSDIEREKHFYPFPRDMLTPADGSHQHCITP